MKLDDAEIYFRKLLAQRPRDAKGLVGLGAVLAMKSKFAESKTHLEQALRIEPDYPELHFWLGKCWEGESDLHKALPCFLQATKIRPDYFEAYNRLAVAQWATGEAETALETFQKAIELNPNHHESYANYGGALFSLGRLEEAEENLNKANAIDSKNGSIHFNLGNIAFTKADYEKAITHYQICVDLSPTDADSYQNLGLALGRKELRSDRCSRQGLVLSSQ